MYIKIVEGFPKSLIISVKNPIPGYNSENFPSKLWLHFVLCDCDYICNIYWKTNTDIQKWSWYLIYQSNYLCITTCRQATHGTGFLSSSGWSRWLMPLTIQLKRRPYKALARASLTSLASTTLRSLTICSPGNNNGLQLMWIPSKHNKIVIVILTTVAGVWNFSPNC